MSDVVRHTGHRSRKRLFGALNGLLAAFVLAFLIAPVLVVLPLSFSADRYLAFPITGLTTGWYAEFFGSERWLTALGNSVGIAVISTVLSVTLGSMAALGLSHPGLPGRRTIEFLLVAPMILPAVIVGVGMYFVFAQLGLTSTYPGLILAHTTLAVPFVVVAVGAAMAGFDRRLLWAAASLGAPPWMRFRRVTLPIILPGMFSGALFAFSTSIDEVVVTLFIAGPGQRTLPREMFTATREQLTPTLLAAAGLLMLIASLLLFASTWVSGSKRRG
ncbi:ABC transporter permease [Ancylobacter sp. WKF20]|uniref:ABC transporter permease n=1 Tax=Ancylobacter sp. WKF20 TaxID=3039801 RepID=UPI0024343C6D|nr:ABC transporter permease [Ancylobacter sp. WKF20]WGD29725.1 ABC transporter permease [Ancylobacter sp. WKF20]